MQTDTRPETPRPVTADTPGPCRRAELLEIAAAAEMPDASALRWMLDRIDLLAEDRRP
ncbi:hypothetical protein QO034_14100 [Sedimentitalea sp. JM2-8]|uniref:Uncharacterized protein n=1 Tax=Sedimentitalea xiamensis TaxID=3050037 RepID=A0ABT7FGN8_9RHOB|nr:hypothetical protein [Sedimentitalea xiamensis]MDK3074247.1 hypothetical protein [Sedimentitalea xiamensis]